MEFDKSRVFTAVNADELRAGDKVIVANNIGQLIDKVERDYPVMEINGHANGYKERRFLVNDGFSYALAYLVERAENCTNCGTSECWFRANNTINTQKVHTCSRRIEPKTEPREKKCDTCKYKNCGFKDIMGDKDCEEYEAEKHYRPFRDTNELVKVWCDKGGKWQKRELTMPYIWVKKHDDTDRGKLIISFSNNGCSVIDVDEIEVLLWEDLFNIYTFLDGSPCGVEE